MAEETVIVRRRHPGVMLVHFSNPIRVHRHVKDGLAHAESGRASPLFRIAHH